MKIQRFITFLSMTIIVTFLTLGYSQTTAQSTEITESTIIEPRNAGAIQLASWNLERTRLASSFANLGYVLIHDAELTYLGFFALETQRIEALTWHPEEELLAMCKSGNEVIILNISTMTIVSSIEVSRCDVGFAWSQPDTIIASPQDVLIWEDGELYQIETGTWVERETMVWDFSGTQFALYNNEQLILNPIEGEASIIEAIETSTVLDIEWHPDNAMLAVAYENGSLVFYDTQSAQTDTITFDYPVQSVRWSTSGDILAVVTGDGLLGRCDANCSFHFVNTTTLATVSEYTITDEGRFSVREYFWHESDNYIVIPFAPARRSEIGRAARIVNTMSGEVVQTVLSPRITQLYIWDANFENIISGGADAYLRLWMLEDL